MAVVISDKNGGTVPRKEFFPANVQAENESAQRPYYDQMHYKLEDGGALHGLEVEVTGEVKEQRSGICEAIDAVENTAMAG